MQNLSDLLKKDLENTYIRRSWCLREAAEKPYMHGDELTKEAEQLTVLIEKLKQEVSDQSVYDNLDIVIAERMLRHQEKLKEAEEPENIDVEVPK